MNIWKMAWRNVWRNKRRTTVTIAAMSFALFVELLYAGLLPGMMEGMEDDVVDLEVGHMQVFGGEYLERPSVYETIPDPEALLGKLHSAGYAAAPRLLGGGLAASEEFSAGVAFRGIEVERDKTISFIFDKLSAGQWVDPADPRGVVIGKRLARTLSVAPGDEMIVLTQATDGSMANDLLTVRGVLMNVADGTDRSTVFMNAEIFRDLFVLPKGAHQLLVRRPDDVDLDTAAAVVTGLADSVEGPLVVKTWRQLMPVVAQMLEGTRGMVLIIFFIVYIAVGILILNAMLMAVFERIREFGVLKALGVGPGKVVGLIFIESGVQAGIALVIGFVSALPFMWYLSTHGIDVGRLGGTDMMGVAMRPVWHGIYRPDVIAGPVVMLVFVVFMAILYPALKAAWISPIRAMNHK